MKILSFYRLPALLIVSIMIFFSACSKRETSETEQMKQTLQHKEETLPFCVPDAAQCGELHNQAMEVALQSFQAHADLEDGERYIAAMNDVYDFAAQSLCIPKDQLLKYYPITIPRTKPALPSKLDDAFWAQFSCKYDGRFRELVTAMYNAIDASSTMDELQSTLASLLSEAQNENQEAASAVIQITMSSCKYWNDNMERWSNHKLSEQGKTILKADAVGGLIGAYEGAGTGAFCGAIVGAAWGGVIGGVWGAIASSSQTGLLSAFGW